MLKWIRHKRLNLKTTIILLVLAAGFWAMFLWVRYENFVPAEFRQVQDSAKTR